MNENWKVRVEHPLHTLDVEIYFYRRTPDGLEILLSNGRTTIVNIGSRENPLPSLTLDSQAFQALIDVLHEQKASPGKFTEGKLEATERHLQDMRTLLKLK